MPGAQNSRIFNSSGRCRRQPSKGEKLLNPLQLRAWSLHTREPTHPLQPVRDGESDASMMPPPSRPGLSWVVSFFQPALTGRGNGPVRKTARLQWPLDQPYAYVAPGWSGYPTLAMHTGMRYRMPQGLADISSKTAPPAFPLARAIITLIVHRKRSANPLKSPSDCCLELLRGSPYLRLRNIGARPTNTRLLSRTEREARSGTNSHRPGHADHTPGEAEVAVVPEPLASPAIRSRGKLRPRRNWRPWTRDSAPTARESGWPRA